jgi:predicted alpha/beta superfamily hydrolase
MFRGDPSTGGHGGVNRLASILALGVAVLIATDASALAAKRMMLRSEVLDEYRPLNVVLPPEQQEGEFYPVVLVLDGDREYIGQVAELMHEAEPGLIIVGVENVNRTRDMFPDPHPEKPDRGGGADLFLSFIVTELIPYIEQEYPVNGIRVLTGQSNSGYFVLHAMVERPYDFDAWVALSPMIGWNEERILGGLSDLFQTRGDLRGGLYVNRGEKDYDRVDGPWAAFEQLHDEHAPEGFWWKVDVVEGDKHVPMDGYRAGIGFVVGQD